MLLIGPLIDRPSSDVTSAEVDLRVGGTWRYVMLAHENQANRDAHVNSGMEAGLQESMDKLEQVARSLL